MLQPGTEGILGAVSEGKVIKHVAAHILQVRVEQVIACSSKSSRTSVDNRNHTKTRKLPTTRNLELADDIAGPSCPEEGAIQTLSTLGNKNENVSFAGFIRGEEFLLFGAEFIFPTIIKARLL